MGMKLAFYRFVAMIIHVTLFCLCLLLDCNSWGSTHCSLFMNGLCLRDAFLESRSFHRNSRSNVSNASSNYRGQGQLRISRLQLPYLVKKEKKKRSFCWFVTALLGLGILVTRAHNKDHQFGVGFFPSPPPPIVARSSKQVYQAKLVKIPKYKSYLKAG